MNQWAPGAVQSSAEAGRGAPRYGRKSRTDAPVRVSRCTGVSLFLAGTDGVKSCPNVCSILAVVVKLLMWSVIEMGVEQRNKGGAACGTVFHPASQESGV